VPQQDAEPLLVELPLDQSPNVEPDAPEPVHNGAEWPQPSFTLSARSQNRPHHYRAPERRRLLPLFLVALLAVVAVAAAWVYRERLAEGASALLVSVADGRANADKRVTLSEDHGSDSAY
jgi:hypothetical protein